MTIPSMESSVNTGFMTIRDMEFRQKLEVSNMKYRIHEDSRHEKPIEISVLLKLLYNLMTIPMLTMKIDS